MLVAAPQDAGIPGLRATTRPDLETDAVGQAPAPCPRSPRATAPRTTFGHDNPHTSGPDRTAW